MQIVTDSTVFEIDASGGDVPADVATQSWVNSQISDFVTDDALTACVPLTGNVNMTGSLSVSNEFNGVELDSSNGVTVWDIDEGKSKEISLDYEGLFVKDYNDVTAKKIDYPTKSGTMVVDADLTAYYTKSETSSAAELADAFAGAGGGGAISAFDLSESPVWSKTMVENALKTNTCLPQTVVQYTDNSISVYDIVGEIGEHDINNANPKKVLFGTNLTSIGAWIFSGKSTLTAAVIPESILSVGEAAFYGANIPCLAIPDSVTTIHRNNTININFNGYVDFGNTRKTVPTVPSNYLGGYGAYCPIYVPDNLYDAWIASSSWGSDAVKWRIHRHSELEAPYLYSSKVTGGAETGTTGTPAAVNAVKSVYETDWATLSATADANTFYVVLPDPE